MRDLCVSFFLIFTFLFSMSYADDTKCACSVCTTVDTEKTGEAKPESCVANPAKEEKPKEKEKSGEEKQKSSDDEYKPKVIYNDGFWLTNKCYNLRVGGYLQVDGRFFLNRDVNVHTFLIRRARLIVTGDVYKLFGFTVIPRWDQYVAGLHQAWIESLKPEYLRFRFGLMRVPFSRESIYSSAYIDFLERSMGIFNYLHRDDTGFMLFGKLFEDRFEYYGGVYNGRARLLDNNNSKEFIARLLAIPFGHYYCSPTNLYFGVSWSKGRYTELLTDLGFVTEAGTRFWKWIGTTANPTNVDDERLRWGVDFEWYYRSAVLRAEFLSVNWGNVYNRTQRIHFSGHSYYVEGTYVLTGEEKRRNKLVIPFCDFNLHGGWGAWEVALRYEQFYASQGPLLIGLANGANNVVGPTLGINWYWNPRMVFRLNLQYAKFNKDVLIENHNVNHETALTIRLQSEF